MDKIYVKYNRERLPKFQTETTLCKDNNELFVRKAALSPSARDHIQNMFENHNLLNNKYTCFHLAAIHRFEDHEITFEYIDGFTIEALLIEAIQMNNNTMFYDILKKYQQLLLILTDSEQPFRSDQSFEELFDQFVELPQARIINLINIDLTFDNIIVQSNDLENPYIIDYGWVFSVSAPLNFLYYRAIDVFYKKYRERIAGFVRKKAVLRYFGITEEEVQIYNRMEEGFQQYVFGKHRLHRIPEGYLKRKYSTSNLLELIGQSETKDKLINKQNLQLQEISDWAVKVQVELKEKDQLILDQNDKIQEVSNWASKLKEQLKEQANAAQPDVAALEAELLKLQSDIHEQESEKIKLEQTIERMKATEEDYAHNLQLVNEVNANLLIDKDSLISDKDTLLAEKESLLAEKAELLAGKEYITAEKESLLAEKAELLADKEWLAGEKESLLAEKALLFNQYTELQSAHSSLQVTLEEREHFIRKQQEEIKAQQQFIIDLNAVIAEQQQYIEHQNNQIAEIQVTVKEQSKVIHELLELKNYLNMILSSRRWKYLQRIMGAIGRKM